LRVVKTMKYLSSWMLECIIIKIQNISEMYILVHRKAKERQSSLIQVPVGSM